MPAADLITSLAHSSKLAALHRVVRLPAPRSCWLATAAPRRAAGQPGGLAGARVPVCVLADEMAYSLAAWQVRPAGVVRMHGDSVPCQRHLWWSAGAGLQKLSRSDATRNSARRARRPTQVPSLSAAASCRCSCRSAVRAQRRAVHRAGCGARPGRRCVRRLLCTRSPAHGANRLACVTLSSHVLLVHFWRSPASSAPARPWSVEAVCVCVCVC